MSRPRHGRCIECGVFVPDSWTDKSEPGGEYPHEHEDNSLCEQHGGPVLTSEAGVEQWSTWYDWVDGHDSEAARAARAYDPAHRPAVRRVAAWEREFADVDEGDGYYWAFVRTEDDGTGKQCPVWFVVEVQHDRDTDEPFIVDLYIPEHALDAVVGWSPRISEPDHLVAPDEIARLRAEVERLQSPWCSDCQGTGYDGSNPCCSCRGTGNVDEARALAERDAARAEVERLHRRWADARAHVAGVVRYSRGSVEAGAALNIAAAMDALSREDGEG